MTVKQYLPPPLNIPATIVHDASHVAAALQPGLPVLLLSAPGLPALAGCAWWRALLAECPAPHALDCADMPGHALEALRLGQRLLVLWLAAPGRQGVQDAAHSLGATILPTAPPALDLARPGALRQLPGWLAQPAPIG